MKRSVFILLLSIAGRQLPASAPAPNTSLPIAECDALIVRQKVHLSNSDLQSSTNFDRKGECILIADDKHPTKVPILILNESVGTLPDSDYLKIIRLVAQHRKINYRSKSRLSNLTKKLIKVPP